MIKYSVDWNNDVGPNDEGYWEWWEVKDDIDHEVICKCDKKEDADLICGLLNERLNK